MRIVLYDYLIKRMCAMRLLGLNLFAEHGWHIPDIKYNSNNTVVWYFAFHYEDKKTCQKMSKVYLLLMITLISVRHIIRRLYYVSIIITKWFLQ